MTLAFLAGTEGYAGLDAAVAALRAGRPALDAVEAAIRPVEVAPTVRSVGLGGWPNLAGEVELDAAILCGTTFGSGAVAAIRGFRHPISVARQVMERLPHVLLVGAGAERFAAEIGAERGPAPAAAATAEDARRAHDAWLRERLPPDVLARWPDVPLVEYAALTADPETVRSIEVERHGTTIALVRDGGGNLASGVSTCGWARKYPGRVGDSAVVGAGIYADSRYGAAGCTGMGELAIRAGTARTVVHGLKSGLGAEAACRDALADLRRLERRFVGGMTIHAIDAAGNPAVVAVGRETSAVRWFHWREGMDAPAEHHTVVEPW